MEPIVGLARVAAWVLLAWLVSALPARAADGPDARLALVVGNSAYAASPLRNPGNDARAMADLLARAGFSVDLRTDTTRVELLGAITRFGQAIRDPKVRFAVFYYAGHGFQQDWRNYLVPVDARVQSGVDVARQTVEVGELIRQMSASAGAKGRSFLVILDACRDDPFAGQWRPPAKGLIPFDAPVGSLLAYATAPGRVAIDGGQAGNGLYTKHLLRELAVPDASIEDAFKRVRLNVRLESNGRQVPWEMASLEDRLYLFPQARGARSDAEQQQRFDAELAAWNRVRLAQSSAELIEFLRAFPTGNASELAQARLNRLLSDELRKAQAEQVDEHLAAQAQAPGRANEAVASIGAGGPAAASAPATTSAPAPAPPGPVMPQPAAATGAVGVARPSDGPLAAAAPAPAVAVRTAESAVAELQPTPFFSGQVEHRRDFRLGQRIGLRVIDQFTGSVQARELLVSAIDPAGDRVEFNGGELVTDLMGNTLANARGALSTPRQFYPAEFAVGKRWQTEFRQSRPNGQSFTFRYQVRVAGRETLTVPAGRFDTWRIEAEGFNVELGASIRRTLWVAPGLPVDVAAETFVRLRNGRVEENERLELVSIGPR